jgi:dihydrofolate synthase / folylpolyglutamate synthase
MKVTAIKTRLVTPRCCTVFDLLDESIYQLQDGSVVAVTSKIVALCEGSVVLREGTDKDELIKQNSEYYLPSSLSPYNVSFSLARNRLVASAGIDETNTGEYYGLLPRDPYKSANEIRKYLMDKFGLQKLGVVITDSTTRPLQWGTTGIAIAYSGFEPLKNYIGVLDLFGRPAEYHKNNIASGLAAAAALCMGEGAEQQPLAVIEDVPFVEFLEHDPTSDELAELEISIADDIYAPFLKNAPWQKGDLAGADSPFDTDGDPVSSE